MKLTERIQEDLKAALRQRDAGRANALRLLKAAIRNAEIDQQVTLDDSGVLAVLSKLAKQRRESIEAYRQGNRPDLVAVEELELQVLESYLPKQLSEDEVRAAVVQAVAELGARGIGDMGRVMKHLTAQLRGQTSGQLLSALTREVLTGQAGLASSGGSAPGPRE